MGQVTIEVEAVLSRVRQALPARMTRISVLLHNKPIELMQGGRSAPGDIPGVQSDRYRQSFEPSTLGGGDNYTARASSGVLYGPFLELGTRKMAPRPHEKRILDAVEPEAVAILSEPY